MYCHIWTSEDWYLLAIVSLSTCTFMTGWLTHDDLDPYDSALLPLQIRSRIETFTNLQKLCLGNFSVVREDHLDADQHLEDMLSLLPRELRIGALSLRFIACYTLHAWQDGHMCYGSARRKDFLNLLKTVGAAVEGRYAGKSHLISGKERRADPATTRPRPAPSYIPIHINDARVRQL